MKRLWLRSCLLLGFLLLLTAVCLTACSLLRPKTPEDMWNRVNIEMGLLDSYEMETAIDLVQRPEGVLTKATAGGKTVVATVNEKNDYYYQSVEATVYLPSGEEAGTSFSVRALHGGKFFYASEIDGKELTKLCANTTVEEFWANNSAEAEFDRMDCTEKTLAQREGGGFTVTLKGYSEGALEAFLETFGIEEEQLGATLTDAVIELTVTEDYRLEREVITLALESNFNVSSDPPSAVITTTYSDYNEAELITEPFNEEEYTLVEDLYCIFDLEEMLKEHTAAENNAFTLILEQTVQIDAYKVETYEKDEVSYGMRDDGYYYTVRFVTKEDGKKKMEGSIAYSQGYRTVIVQLQGSERLPQSEKAARDFTASLLSVPYSSSYVKNVTVKGDGVYTVQRLIPNISAYEDYFAANGFTYQSAEHELEFTVRDGKITKIVSRVEAHGNKPQRTMSFVDVQTIVFDDEDGSETDVTV